MRIRPIVRTLLLGLVSLVAVPALTAHAQPYAPPGYAPPPPEAGPRHFGFTLGFGIGGGTMALDCNGCDGLQGLAAEFHIGAFLTPQLALMFDGSTVIHPFSNGGGTLSSNFGAAAIQFWLNRFLWIKGGLGLGYLEISDAQGYALATSQTGFGGLLAVGVELLQMRRFALDVQLRGSTAHFSDATITNVGLLVGFNWY